jgi:hypothetical protein
VENEEIINSKGKLPQELVQLLENLLAGARMGAVFELEKLLKGSNSELAGIAYQWLIKLADDDSKQVSKVASGVLATINIPPHIDDIKESINDELSLKVMLGNKSVALKDIPAGTYSIREIVNGQPRKGQYLKKFDWIPGEMAPMTVGSIIGYSRRPNVCWTPDEFAR